MYFIETPRLLLRDWKQTDMPLFAAMNADPKVMEYFPAPLSPEMSEAFLTHIREEFRKENFGLFAVERRTDSQLLGFVGLHRVVEQPEEFRGAVEIGWRLRAAVWGNGYAPEAAAACLDYAGKRGLREIISFTALANLRSQRVMQKIGMVCDHEFDHPALPEGHPLKRHILYRFGSAAGE